MMTNRMRRREAVRRAAADLIRGVRALVRQDVAEWTDGTETGFPCWDVETLAGIVDGGFKGDLWPVDVEGCTFPRDYERAEALAEAVWARHLDAQRRLWLALVLESRPRRSCGCGWSCVDPTCVDDAAA